MHIASRTGPDLEWVTINEHHRKAFIMPNAGLGDSQKARHQSERQQAHHNGSLIEAAIEPFETLH